MTLRQLELFIAVAETKSFSRGAERMMLTQSTVSQHIAALESEVKSVLLDRTSRGIFLTTAGELLLRHARRVLAERDILVQALDSLRGLEQATLHLGASNIPANHLIPSFLPELQSAHPGITLAMKIGDSRGISEDLISGQIELAIVGGKIDGDVCTYEPLLKDHLVMVVGPQHRLRKRRSITLEELKEQEFILRENGSGTYQAFKNELSILGFNPESFSIIARLGNNEAVRRAVSAGAGCAFVSDLSVQNDLRQGELFKIDVDGLTIERQIWLVRLRERTVSPAAEAFSALLKQSPVLGHLAHSQQI